MMSPESLRELTESYLKSIISEAASSLSTDFDSFAAFAELGIDSFYVLKIIKKLEAEFGALPKTLLFENFNVSDLARYFVSKHDGVLAAKFAPQLQVAGSAAHRVERRLSSSANTSDNATRPKRADLAAPAAAPILLLEKQAYAHPQLRGLVRALFERHKNEGSVSRGTRNIAANLFIGSERRGYFNYARYKNLILAYAYTGPEDYFSVIAREMHQHCVSNNLQLNILCAHAIESIGDTPFSSTPFGVLQRIVNIRDFTLEGGAMRRLRYQVSKFQKVGACATEEYRCGTNQALDASIAGVIDDWCAGKTMVNPLIHIVRDEILAGTLDPLHRIFLTYVDDALKNVILITPLAATDCGYLMDLEFYTRDMPLGGLEFAIVKIIEKLVAEGCNLLSLGGTYGCRLDTSPNADPGVDRILDDLHKQNIFNDAGNLQFKNKFRPENRTLYLCRAVAGSDPDSVIDIIMMIADPARAQTSDEENHNFSGAAQQTAASASALAPVIEIAHAGRLAGAVKARKKDKESAVERTNAGAVSIAGERRSVILCDFGFNPLNIPPEQVDFDLKTDSWAQLKLPSIDTQMRHLHAQLQQAADVDESLRGIFPFTHFTLTASGRTAEQVLCKAWPRRGIVLENLLFPTGLFHQINEGFTPRELPHREVFRLDSAEEYKGNLAWEALQAEVAKDPAAIAFVCLELSNNAAGGYAVSIQHLEKVRALLAQHSIPLVIDATRVVDNALFLLEREDSGARRSTWAVVQDLLSYADVVIGSLAKNFCVDRGGIIATNDAKLFHRFQQLVHEEGVGLDALDRSLVALSLQNRQRIETQVARRIEAVQSICRALQARDIPVVQPAGGHCILIDVKRVAQFGDFQYPVASFVAWMYLNSGIRAGAHSVGMQRGTAINDLVRLAIPVGMKAAQIADITDRLLGLFERKVNIPEIVLDGSSSKLPGDVHARYELKQYHNVAGKILAADDSASAGRDDADVTHLAAQSAAPPSAVVAQNAPQQEGRRISTGVANAQTLGDPVAARVGTTYRPQDIAIVGMAGRYPKARNLQEMWQNLRQGIDCIEELPADRYERRRQYEPIEKYRGGFIGDVDKFDSLFFNISPREAEMLDPQERLFLEVAWEALEDAGYYPEILVREEARRDIGVFVGAVWAMYQMLGVEERHVGGKVSPNSFLWSIANRVSYFMNLSGPSLTLDTACSSSLTALYLACEAIYSGQCSAAIVGGVNLDLHQGKLDINLVGGALSSDGVCRSFGKGANGYVAGEGVGALLLKPLHQAAQDGDNIHGVIKSIAVNHGGRASGYTVPNPRAQANLVATALQRAGIDARSIGYIEAHGTGTELGDPIETTGLTTAFESYAVKNQSCAIGSIKTNIGHLEAAAGVVGVCKVLLQMKHRRIAPSLHSSELNELIDFAHSPFYVVQELEEWQPKQIDGVQFPLRAGVSSFGAGGSNAHVILESYEPAAAATADQEAARPEEQTDEQIFPLSARSEEQLHEMASRLSKHLQQQPVEQDTAAQQQLRRISYTLQVGRKSFDCRLAILARTTQELIELLNAFSDGGKSDKILVGNVKNAASITRLLSRKEQEEFVNLLCRSRDSYKLAQLWIDGLLADWQGFHARGAGRRISLPTYPFADKRHWIRGSSASVRAASQPAPGMHPLVDTNESTFERQLFKKTFHERDFFIYDHLVADIPTLPGVAYLELARKAGEIAAGRAVRRIRNILWLSPIAVQRSTPKEVWIELKPSGEVVQFEVFSATDDGGKLLHSQGKLAYATRQETAAEPEYVDLDGIRARCAKVIDGKDAYPLFKSFGLNLGPSFQVLEEVYKNESETLGVLRLPQSRHGDLQSMLLHPSLVDGSLQAGVSAQLGEKTGEMLVPFSIGEVEILHPLQPDCFSYVTVAKEGGKESSKVSKANVLILDEKGRILVRIRESAGVPLREVHKEPAASHDVAGSPTLYYSYEWEQAPLHGESAEPDRLQPILLFDTDATLHDLYRERLEKSGGDSDQVILIQPAAGYEDAGGQRYKINPQRPQDFAQLLQSLRQKKVAVERICFAWSARSAAPQFHDDAAVREESLQSGIYSLLFLCQALIAQKLEGKVQLLYLYLGKSGEVQPHNDAINGFAKALHIEHPRFFCKTLQIQQEDATASRILDGILAEFHPHTLDTATVRYQGQERYVRKLRAIDVEDTQRASAPAGVGLKDKGVYLITGGAGGLGLIFAQFLAKQCAARLVLTGRSKLSAQREAQLEELRKAGAEVLYLPIDVCVRAQVETLIAQSKRHFGRIDGIIHAAGVLRDSYIRNKTREEMAAVLAPKLHGTVHLDELTRQEPLDFFVMFSSLAAIGGNAGQCDYCFANHYMDSFAGEREILRSQGKRSGKTLSLNWSLWADGGMQLDEQTELLFRKATGIEPLSTAAGLQAFLRGLASDTSQLAVVAGVQDRIELAWGLRKKQPQAAATPALQAAASSPAGGESAAAPDDLAALVQKELAQIVMEFLKLDAEDTAPDKVLLDLGFDSIGLVTFANTINEKYGLDITPVLFFDYPSIVEVAKYLAVERTDEVRRFHRVGAGSSAAVTIPAAQPPAAAAHSGQEPSLRTGKGWDPRRLDHEAIGPASGEHFSAELRFVNKPIAIVGMSGVMPQSENLEEFWDNLRNARDLVTVIPEDRWSWEDYYGDPLKESNKSNSKWGAFMKEVDKFDPLFFGISPREAQMMDPQQRIFLETVWKAVEDAGQKVSDLAGTRTGLFVGVATNDYIDLMNTQRIDLDGYSASGNSHSVLANRVSFLLNLRGPSAPLDTACSSSLVAIHRAVESIHTGSCDMAIAGGVQVMLTPAAFISFGMAGMLSGDGKCKTFDKRANGYVRGEGCGAIFLKPLSMAEADGNHIYAVIRATAENHGGRVTTLTAPNATAQAELLIEAYEKARFDPATVGYIECHGTGTSLGDPIEIQALTRSFAELYKRHNKAPAAAPHCGLSAVKTNIGHLETAAGIAGVLKVLLAIKHRQIPANVHFEEVNPYINLKGSPFYIVDKTTPWTAPMAEDGSALPRRAGVSSFGFGGANAHIVLEEYIPSLSRPASPGRQAGPEPQLIVLSAKNEDRLRAYAKSMLSHLQSHALELADLAYTLQLGRDEMPQRLALVVSSTQQLQEDLAAFIHGSGAIANGYHNNTKNKQARSALVAEGGAAEGRVRDLLEQRELQKLAQLWVAGVEIDWRPLHRTGAARRISIPTYPFARERHWIAVHEPRQRSHAGSAATAFLHPLIHRNISTLQEQKFASRFTGEEFFLADHSLETQRILPGVAYMEMARAAAALSGMQEVRRIRNIVWMTPLAVADDAKEVEIALLPDHDEVEFTIRTVAGDRAVTHCHGKLAPAQAVAEPDALDVAEIKRRCSEEIIQGPDLYAFLCTSALKFGRGFQVVQRVHAGRSECLAVLQLPEHLKDGASQFALHPAMMDGSLHTAIGLVKRSAEDIPWSLPYSVREVQIFRPLQDLHYGYATWDADTVKDEQSLIRMSFHLLDSSGKVLLRMTDLIAKPFQQGPAATRTIPAQAAEPLPKGSGSQEETRAGLQSLVPIWNPLPSEARRKVAPPATTRILLLGGDPAGLEWVQRSYPNAQLLHLAAPSSIEIIETQLVDCGFDQLLWIAPDAVRKDAHPLPSDASIIAQQEAGVLTVFRITKALLRLGYASKLLQWTLITRRTQRVMADEETQPTHAAVLGLIGSLAKEYPHWSLRLLDVDSLDAVSADQCLSLAWDKQGDGLAHRRSEWFRQGFARVAALPQAPPAYRQGGVYVVIGGAGGLGEVWSRFLIERYHARMVWIGRQECTAAIQAKIDSLGRLGQRPLYIAADATKLEALEQACRKIREIYPTIHGVVHSAIVLHDQSVAQMDESTFRASLSAKVDVSVNLARVFGQQALDFMLFFSSIVSFHRSPGQSNYAAGCTFKDSFAQSLQRQCAHPVKIMNWGYWGNVGIVANPSYKKLMEQMGVGSIEPQEGMASLQELVSCEMPQMALIKTLDAQALADVDSFETIAYYPRNDAAAAEILTHVRAALPEQVSAERLAVLQAELPSADQDALVTEILAASLMSLGCFGQQGARGAESLLDKQPAQLYRRWLSTSIHHLQRQGWLSESLTPNRNVRSPVELWSQWDASKVQWAVDANRRAQANLLEACLKALPSVLSGKQLATDVIFPRSSMQLVEGMYRGNAVADYFNDVLGHTLAACVERWLQQDSERKIRILEIGAGTGGTTSQLLPVLQRFADAIVEYCYTDVSKAFLMYAMEHYRPRCAALTTAIFDVTKPLASQPIVAGNYDVVIASNVLHATPSITETVRNAKAALKSHGVLLLNEISTWSLFSHLTFGLLEGWWLHEDSAVRLPGSPGLAPAKWQEILAEEGFAPVFFPAERAHKLGQQIVAASSDGRVRQRIARRAPTQPSASLKHTGTPATGTAAGWDRPAANDAALSVRVTEQMSNDYIRKTIKEKLSEALRMDAGMIGDDAPFAEYGVDSIIGVNLVRTINEALQIELATTSLFEHSTVTALAQHISSEWQEQVARQTPAAEGIAQKARSLAADEPDGVTARARSRTIGKRFLSAGDASHHADEKISAHSINVEPIAIIGMSGRFAESESLHDFWRNLADGKDLVKEVSRWRATECVIPGSTTGKYCDRGSFVDSIDLFDPQFFRISALEALYMDPQQRLFLEESWKALEDAGYAGAAVNEKQCGIYVGCGSSNYDDLFVAAPPAQAFWGNSEAVIPARIAYYLNLRGPAIAVNTACSSSLVSIHLACQSLWSQETEMSLAGGVFLQATCGFYQVSNRAGMLSLRGRCQSFDSAADGFVPGEGVGVVVLKRLHDALRDADHIHGVIAGSGINQDGSSNGLIAPNAAAQERLERSVYDRFGINPETIQVLEAHGTGTILGDSIEHGAITRSFRHYTDRKQFCAIGSVKTNIGHAATAAGVAAVLKVLLALKHRQIPPCVHFQKGNPGINFEASPFYVNTELQDWQVADGQVRRAAISSFGFSGTNAHLVIEEAPAVTRKAAPSPGYMVSLSARTAEQLQQQVRNLLALAVDAPELSMNDLSYSLLVGRMHLSHRLACIARDRDELIQLLKQWLETGAASQIYTAQLQEGKVRERISLKKFGNHCIQECRDAAAPADYLEHLATIADLYAQGYSLDFHALFPEGSRRIPLPTYPFARERYWIETTDAATSPAASAAAAVLHPLLHANTSDFSQQSYSSTFTGEEFFLDDQQMIAAGRAGERIFPGGVCLEMARAAVEKAVPNSHGSSILELHHITWAQPIVVTGRKQVTIALLIDDDERMDYEIYGTEAGQETVYCQGRAVFSYQPAPAPLDIAHLRAQMQRGKLDSSSVYAAFSDMGLHYGPAHRAISAIHLGEKQRLVQLQLPPAVPARQEAGRLADYLLHPSFMAGALQACVALIADSGMAACRPVLPIGLESLRIVSACTAEMFAWVRYSKRGEREADIVRLDVDLMDAQGNVCVQMRSLSLAVRDDAVKPATSSVRSPGGQAGSMAADEKMELFLKQEVALQLHRPMQEIATDQNYFDLGLTSLGIADLVRKTNQLLEEDFPPSIVFEYRDVRSLAAHLAATYPAKIAALAVSARQERRLETAGQQRTGWQKLSPLPRRRHLAGGSAGPAKGPRGSAAPAAEIDAVQVLEKVLWREGMDAGDYEKVVF